MEAKIPLSETLERVTKQKRGAALSVGSLTYTFSKKCLLIYLCIVVRIFIYLIYLNTYLYIYHKDLKNTQIQLYKKLP